MGDGLDVKRKNEWVEVGDGSSEFFVGLGLEFWVAGSLLKSLGLRFGSFWVLSEKQGSRTGYGDCGRGRRVIGFPKLFLLLTFSGTISSDDFSVGLSDHFPFDFVLYIVAELSSTLNVGPYKWIPYFLSILLISPVILYGHTWLAWLISHSSSNSWIIAHT